MIILNNVPYTNGENEKQGVDFRFPDNKEFSTLVWFHGGGIENGSRKSDSVP